MGSAHQIERQSQFYGVAFRVLGQRQLAGGAECRQSGAQLESENALRRLFIGECRVCLVLRGRGDAATQMDLKSLTT